MAYFATITRTRHGWHAKFGQRLPGAYDLELIGLGATRWRRSRAGIERAAGRFLRRLNASDQTRDQRRAASYEYIGVD